MLTPEDRLVQKLWAVVDRAEMPLFFEIVPSAAERLGIEPPPPLNPPAEPEPA